MKSGQSPLSTPCWANIRIYPSCRTYRATLRTTRPPYAYDGLFHYIAQEEAAIRSDPVARTTDILKQVFGELADCRIGRVRVTQRHKKSSPLLAGLATLIAVFAIYYSDLSITDRMRNVLFDTYQVLHPREPYDEPPVVILDIDEQSLERVGQWPWPRSYLAQIVDYLQRAGVGVIAFDVFFSEADRTSPRLGSRHTLRRDPVLALRNGPSKQR